MINGSDWSQFIPDLVVGLLVLFVAATFGAIFTYTKSEKFRKLVKQMYDELGIGLKWLIGKWRLILLTAIIASVNAIVFRVYDDWKTVVLSIINFAIGLFGYTLLLKLPLTPSGKKLLESESKFLPGALPPGIGNAYLKSRYIDPPLGDTISGEVRFLLKPDSLIFDTNEHIRYYSPRDDGSKEIDLPLAEPTNKIKAVHFLINSGNSKTIYSHANIGEICLLFKDAPPIVIPLVLGENVREWCPGNPGDWVRETSSPAVVRVWLGVSKSGTNAVIDRLTVSVYECMRNCFLEKIKFVHKSISQQPDTMGVHFSVFAVSLEIEGV